MGPYAFTDQENQSIVKSVGFPQCLDGAIALFGVLINLPWLANDPGIRIFLGRNFTILLSCYDPMHTILNIFIHQSVLYFAFICLIRPKDLHTKTLQYAVYYIDIQDRQIVTASLCFEIGFK
jgi:hypothetical protein